MATEQVKVYKLISPNGKIYIGQTIQKLNRRWRNGNGYKHNRYLYNAIMKYGWENFEHELVCDNLSQSEADWLEKYLISYYNTMNVNYGYNLVSGGNLKKEISEETRLKLSLSHKGLPSGAKGRKLSDEEKKHLSEVNLGKQAPWVSILRKGKPSPNRHKIKINGVIYDSYTKAASYLNISLAYLSMIIKGKKNNTLKLNYEII